jgi:hypothetical protein
MTHEMPSERTVLVPNSTLIVCAVLGVGLAEFSLTGCGGARTTSGTVSSGTVSSGTVSAPRTVSKQVREITFDDIKLDLAKDEAFTRDRLTPRVTELDGGRVRIRGYILPSFQQRGLTQFVLVRDNQECCFGPGAALHDCVVVRMQPGATADFSIRPVAVTGGFRVEELRGPDGRHLAIYALDGENVQ